jgi:hypothetical protein
MHTYSFEVDAAAFGVLASVLASLFDMPLCHAVEATPDLIADVIRVMQRYYPRHARGNSTR